jgi:hypothetical protein
MCQPHELTVTVTPAKEPWLYPVWHFDSPSTFTRPSRQRTQWCWTAQTTGLPDTLQQKFATCGADELHALINPAPAYFFYGADSHACIWEWPGKQNTEAPTLIGIEPSGRVHMAEILWHEGWTGYGEIEHHAKRYAASYASSKLSFGGPVHMPLTLHLAAPGVFGKSFIKDMVSATGRIQQTLRQVWQDVHCRIGLIQCGWVQSQSDQHLLRVYWFDAASWDDTRQDFHNRQPQLVPLAVQT